MRSRYVHMRVVLLSILAALALSAVASSAAQAAVEGPFVKVAGTRLLEGQSKELKVKAYKEGGTGVYALTLRWGTGIGVYCKNEKFAAGAKLTGSTGANFAYGEGALEFSGCEATGDGTSCGVANKAFTTETLKLELVYSTSTRSGPIAVVLKPAKNGTFGWLRFAPEAGGKCTTSELKITGSMSGELQHSEAAVEVGKEPAEANTDEVDIRYEEFFPTIWSEKSGALTESEPQLVADGIAFEVLNRSVFEVAGGSTGGAQWGVFT